MDKCSPHTPTLDQIQPNPVRCGQVRCKYVWVEAQLGSSSFLKVRCPFGPKLITKRQKQDVVKVKDARWLVGQIINQPLQPKIDLKQSFRIQGSREQQSFYVILLSSCSQQWSIGQPIQLMRNNMFHLQQIHNNTLVISFFH